MDGWVSGWMDGWVSGMDGWMDGWMDRWMDGWVDVMFPSTNTLDPVCHCNANIPSSHSPTLTSESASLFYSSSPRFPPSPHPPSINLAPCLRILRHK